MAAKKSKARSKAKATVSTPAVRHLRYHLTNGEGGVETSHFIDLARDLSVVNRRLYRQGRDYHVKKISIVSSNTPNLGNRVSVSVIPSGWASRQAWHRTFKLWKHMQAEVLEQVSGDILGTWSDFKTDMSVDSRLATLAVPLDNGSIPYLLGEWNMTDFVSPDGTASHDQFRTHMIGDHVGAVGNWSSIGLIKSYGESRATVHANDPNVPSFVSDDPLINVFDYGTTIDEIGDLIEAENDNPPYDIAGYNGGSLNGAKPMVVQDTTIVDGRGSLGGFTALCGVIEVEITSALPGDVYSILVELAPGKFRGIKAESI